MDVQKHTTQKQRRGIVLVQLGSPKSPRVRDVRRYLKEFLGDPRVVDLPRWLWAMILHVFVLPLRPFRSAKLYARIWQNGEFPLTRWTRVFAQKLQSATPDHIEVREAFILSSPSVSQAIDELCRDQVEDITFIPMFPQYAEASSASAMDTIAKSLRERTTIPAFKIVNDFHDDENYIVATANHIAQHLKEASEWDRFYLSFHGYPVRRIQLKNDPYLSHCERTAQLIISRLERHGIDRRKITVTFQSKFGREDWLEPATDKEVLKNLKEGDRRIVVYCPGFVADCLETVDEIGHELKTQFLQNGGQEFHLIPCLNDSDQWVEAFSRFVQHREPNRLTPSTEGWNMPAQKKVAEPLSADASRALKGIFITMFLDLIGFSIIFPLFPSMLSWYTTYDQHSTTLDFFLNIIHQGQRLATADQSTIILFGGLLGGLYSLLQFLFAPVWGTLSDRFGRKLILVICITGLALSYVGWFFAGTFLTLVLARTLGGIMAGNISVATAAAADVTTERTRSRGMAIVGMAFGLGFILGPTIGGISSLFDLTLKFPDLVSWGLNPFSAAAGISFVLTLINLLFVMFHFKETLPPNRNPQQTMSRTINPLAILETQKYPGVTRTLIVHFIYLTIFSGMEFSLTFLAAERLHFTPMDNGWMFLFIGFVLAMVQGGYVRRSANTVGEKKMAIQGFATIIPGLLLVGFAHSTIVLYAGLFLLAFGSALVIPCLTALVSLYTPAHDQGRVIGIFRSLGALARAVGPMVACIIYWKFAATASYIAAAVGMAIPLLVAMSLQKPTTQKA